MTSRVFTLLLLAAWSYSSSARLLYFTDVSSVKGYEVTYDDRSFIIAGNRTLLLSGSVHYPRSTPGMWDGLFQTMVEDGLNMVETYVFWNLHEPDRMMPYNFGGYANLMLFLQKAAEAGLFVNLRIGPFVGAEWSWGGLPIWLRDIPQMSVRSNNYQWKEEMSRFVKAIASLVSPFLAKNGGPIVMAQIENEYRWIDGILYVEWCGELANGLGLAVPWVMCNGISANNTINTCNGNDCAGYAETHSSLYPQQPLAWTEDEGWYEKWGQKPNVSSFDNRTPESVAFAVMKWFARGGCHHNYYMWYGGNHFSQWAAAGVANKYADGVNLHHDTLHNEPKKSHLQKLHKLLAKYSNVLLDYPSQISHKYVVEVYDSQTGRYITATQQWAYVYKGDEGALIFIENEANVTALIKVSTGLFLLPPLSATLADFNSMTELYNSAQVPSTGVATERVFSPLVSTFNWSAWQEDVSSLSGYTVEGCPKEQLNFTLGKTDYLFYQTKVDVYTAGVTSLEIKSRAANAFVVFIDGSLQNATFNTDHASTNITFFLPLKFSEAGSHQLTLLSVDLGISNRIDPGSFDYKGVCGGVYLGEKDITNQLWIHRPMLKGEILHVYTTNGSSNVTWDNDYQKYVEQPVVWFQAKFPRVSVPSGHSILLDLAGMGCGHFYLNGFSLGRYWSIKVGGAYVQRYYFIPPDLVADSNLLTMVEEVGAPDPDSVALLDSTFVVP